MTRLGDGLARGGALVWALCGCGETVSLDAVSDPDAEASDTTTAASSSSEGGTDGTTDAADGANDDQGTPPDLPVDPPVGACEPGCELELTRRWTWRSDAPDEQRREWSPHRFSALAWRDDGFIFVAEQRGGLMWITALDEIGELLWDEPLFLPCDCEVIDLAASPWGDVAFTAQARDSASFPRMLVGRFEVWGTAAPWSSDISFGIEPERPPRMGSVIPLGGFFGGFGGTGAVAIVPLDSSMSPVRERVALYTFDGFANFLDPFGSTVDTQLATTSGTRPIGIEVGDDRVAVMFPATTGEQEQGYAVWLESGSFAPVDAQALPGLPDDVARDSEGRLLALTHRVPQLGQLELHLELRAPDLPVSWQTTRVIETEMVAPAQVATHRQQESIVLAVPLLRGQDEETERGVELIGLVGDGSVQWRRTVPLRAESGLGLGMMDDGGILLSTTVGDRVVTEVWDPECVCE